MIKNKRIVHVFVTPDVFNKLLKGDGLEAEEFIVDPSEVDGLEVDIRFTSKVLNEIIYARFEKETRCGVLTKWELVNCTFEEKMRIIHRLDQVKIV